MRRLTLKQIDYICKNNKYIVLRCLDNDIIAINCKVSEISKRKHKDKLNLNKKSNYVGFYPCSFQEYISLKTPFI
jgi:hypothetical protein